MATIPEPSPKQQWRADRLVGLPYVCLVEDMDAATRYVYQLRNGDRVRAETLEDVFNAGLIIEAIEGPGSAARSTMPGPQGRLHAELLAAAEKLFGVTIREALPLYLKMERTTYGTWDDRPRVKWPRPVVS